MISAPDRPWCPDCREQRWSYQTTDDGACGECGTPVVDTWPWWVRVKRRVLQSLAATVAGAFVLGPPIWTIYKTITYDGPLFAMKTTTVTRSVPTGLVVDVGSVLVPWLFLLTLMFAIPGMPRRI